MKYFGRHCTHFVGSLSIVFALAGSHSTQAATPPFTEDFANGVADWADSGSFPLSFVTSGGADGGYVTTDFAFDAGGGAGGTSAVLFRGHDEYGSSGSSGGAFVGDWISDGVGRLTAQVRHNAPLPLTFFFRGSGPFNFPGATAVDFVPVLPNVWTEISFDVGASSGQFMTFEGSDYNTVFSNLGHVQFGVDIPPALASDPVAYSFDLDRVTITVPEPATISLIIGVFLLGFRGRRPATTRTEGATWS